MVMINGETITGIALAFLALLFIFAATVNKVWALLLPADYLILAIGGAFIVLGIISIRKYRDGELEEQSHQ